jgi:hypothetical protein
MSRKQSKQIKNPRVMQRSSANGTCQNLLTRRVVLTAVAVTLGGSRADISLHRYSKRELARGGAEAATSLAHRGGGDMNGAGFAP